MNYGKLRVLFQAKVILHENIHKMFKNLVDFDKEFLQIKEFFENLV